MLITKKVFLFTLLLIITQSLFAQVNFGVKGGLNESYIDAGTYPSTTKGHLRPGFHIGAFAEFEFNKWSFEPGLFFSVKGYKVTSDAVQPTPGGPVKVSISGTQTYQYLELPLNMLYNIKTKPGKIFIGGGPYMGYLLSVTGKRNTTVNGVNTYTETNYAIGGNGNFKRTDFGVNALTGITFKNGLLFNVSYSYGFTNIVINNINGNPNITKNRVIGFSAGYTF